MDFNDIEDQIELNKDRLKEETERYNEVRSRIALISIVYTLFAAYGFQLIVYWIREDNIGFTYSVLLIIFLALVITSIIFSVLLIHPVKIAYKDLPFYFYDNLKNEYIAKGILEDETDIYIKNTYRIQLETAVKTNFEINNKKSKFHYYAFVTALLAIIPYVACIGISLSNQKEEPIKVELINKIFNDMSKEKSISDSSKTKQDVDTSKIIVKPPVLIRENESKDKQTRTTDNERGQKKD